MVEQAEARSATGRETSVGASGRGDGAPLQRLPGPLGILGGGQLGRMTVQAAADLGLETVIAERFADSPAARLTAQSVVFPYGWDDAEPLDELARRAPLITLENEFVDAQVLRKLEARGSRVVPTPASVATVQDKLVQKQALAAADLPVPPFRPVETPADVAAVGTELGWPLVLKARRDGYDGYGNALVESPDAAAAACVALGWPRRALYAEALVGFARELAVVVVRGQDGCTASYPVVESQQDPERHICRVVLAPAPIAREEAERATSLACLAVEAVSGVGAFGVELFLLPDGSVSVNELAPRPHNSGHYTIEACVTSQFANHVRAVLGLPLGDPAMRVPAAAMVNLLGTGASALGPDALASALAVPGVFVHLYGKRESRPGRKMGHVTALGADQADALERASRTAAFLRL